MTSLAPTDREHYVHDAFFHAGLDDLVTWAGPHLREGLEAGEHAVVVGDEPTGSALVEAVDDERLVVVDRRHVYQRVPVALATYQKLMSEGPLSDGRPVRVIGAVDYGPTRETQRSWAGFEAVCNRYLEEFPLWATCIYDTNQLPTSVIVDGIMTHPYIRDRSGRRFNDDFMEPDEFLRSLGSGIKRPRDALATYSLAARSELAQMRASLDTILARAGVNSEARASCLVTIGELSANSFLHGVPPVDVMVSMSDDNQLVIDVHDRGIGFDDPFYGYVVGSPEALPTDGRGLWMVRHLCSAIETAHVPDGFLVRAAVDPAQPRLRDLLV
jgi:anti-sigma regulatory factor (Ser/Thr protein kinase)